MEIGLRGRVGSGVRAGGAPCSLLAMARLALALALSFSATAFHSAATCAFHCAAAD